MKRAWPRLAVFRECETRVCSIPLWLDQHLHAYRPECTISELAAAYAYGVARNRPFVDGNKRAAFLTIGLFLAVHRLKLVTDQLDAIQTMLAVAAGNFEESALAAWIEKNSASR